MKLEKMMKNDGWVLGYEMHGSIRYWTFRKGEFEIDENNIRKVDKDFDKPTKRFTPWKEESSEK